MAIADAEPKKPDITSTGGSKDTPGNGNNSPPSNKECSASSNKLYLLHEDKTFAFSVPHIWDDRNIGIFIECCMENIEDLKRPGENENKIWTKIAKCGRDKTGSATCFRLNDCLELAKSLKNYFIRNDKLVENKAFKEFHNGMIELLQYFPGGPVNKNMRSKSTDNKNDLPSKSDSNLNDVSMDIQEQNSHNIDVLIVKELKEYKSTNPKSTLHIWNKISRILSEKHGVEIDVKKKMYDLKKNIIEEVRNESDFRKKFQKFMHLANDFAEYFDHMPPRNIKKKDLLGPYENCLEVQKDSENEKLGHELVNSHGRKAPIKNSRMKRISSKKTYSDMNSVDNEIQIESSKCLGKRGYKNLIEEDTNSVQETKLAGSSLSTEKNQEHSESTAPLSSVNNIESPISITRVDSSVDLLSEPEKKKSANSKQKINLKRNIPERKSATIFKNGLRVSKRTPRRRVKSKSEGTSNANYRSTSPGSSPNGDSSPELKGFSPETSSNLKSQFYNQPPYNSGSNKVDFIFNLTKEDELNPEDLSKKKKIYHSQPEVEKKNNASVYNIFNLDNKPSECSKVKNAIVVLYDINATKVDLNIPKPSTSFNDSVSHSTSKSNKDSLDGGEHLGASSVTIIERHNNEREESDQSKALMQLIPSTKGGHTTCTTSRHVVLSSPSQPTSSMSNMQVVSRPSPEWLGNFVTEYRKHEHWKMGQLLKVQKKLVDIENKKLNILKKILGTLKKKRS